MEPRFDGAIAAIGVVAGKSGGWETVATAIVLKESQSSRDSDFYQRARGFAGIRSQNSELRH